MSKKYEVAASEVHGGSWEGDNNNLAKIDELLGQLSSILDTCQDISDNIRDYDQHFTNSGPNKSVCGSLENPQSQVSRTLFKAQDRWNDAVQSCSKEKCMYR